MLSLTPITLREANAFVEQHHRHHGPSRGCIVCLAVADEAGAVRLITYTLDTERGASLKAAGMRVVAEVRGRSWSCETRPRVDTHLLQGKLRWEIGA